MYSDDFFCKSEPQLLHRPPQYADDEQIAGPDAIYWRHLAGYRLGRKVHARRVRGVTAKEMGREAAFTADIGVALGIGGQVPTLTIIEAISALTGTDPAGKSSWKPLRRTRAESSGALG